MRILTVAVAALLLSSCSGPKSGTQTASSANSISSSEKKDGWKLLFDGTTTNGWHSFNKPAPGSAWKAVDGTLFLDTVKTLNGQPVTGGDIVSADEYGNFHLKLEWKISKNGNSGIIFFIKEDPKYKYGWYTGPEMQILDNEGHADGKITKHRTGDLYDLIKSTSEPVKPVGEWNQVEIISKDGKLDLWLNGVNTVSTIVGDAAWNALVAGSKFKTQPDFAKNTTGRIGLQDHGNQVWFRNIKIKQL